MSLTSFIKGWAGEAMGAVAHWAFLDKSIYFPLNNLTLPTKNGTTQIDHVIVSKFGIFVIEAKNIDGWIAVLEGPDKKGYFVRVGQRMHDGVITAVDAGPRSFLRVF